MHNALRMKGAGCRTVSGASSHFYKNDWVGMYEISPTLIRERNSPVGVFCKVEMDGLHTAPDALPDRE